MIRWVSTLLFAADQIGLTCPNITNIFVVIKKPLLLFLNPMMQTQIWAGRLNLAKMCRGGVTGPEQRNTVLEEHDILKVNLTRKW